MMKSASGPRPPLGKRSQNMLITWVWDITWAPALSSSCCNCRFKDMEMKFHSRTKIPHACSSPQIKEIGTSPTEHGIT